jgi:hypothetical protein
MAYTIAHGRRFRSTDNTLVTVKSSVALVNTRTPAQQLKSDTLGCNRILGEMTHNTYHDGVPLDTINWALRCKGFDELEPMLLCGAQGSLNEPVGRNRWLSLTWYKMESGRYEVIAYVS